MGAVPRGFIWYGGKSFRKCPSNGVFGGCDLGALIFDPLLAIFMQQIFTGFLKPSTRCAVWPPSQFGDERSSGHAAEDVAGDEAGRAAERIAW